MREYRLLSEIAIQGWRREAPPCGASSAEHSGVWKNYDSVSIEKDWSDRVAAIGGRWDDAPKPFADSNETDNSTHVGICLKHCVPP